MKKSKNTKSIRFGSRRKVAAAMAAAAAFAGTGFGSKKSLSTERPSFDSGAFTKIDPQKVQEQFEALNPTIVEQQFSAPVRESVVNDETISSNTITSDTTSSEISGELSQVEIVSPITGPSLSPYTEPVHIYNSEDYELEENTLPEAEIEEVLDAEELELVSSTQNIEIIDPISYVHVTLGNEDAEIAADDSISSAEDLVSIESANDDATDAGNSMTTELDEVVDENIDVERISIDDRLTVDLEDEDLILDLDEVTDEELIGLHEKLQEAVMSAVEVDPNDIVNALEYDFDELGIISSTDGEDYVAATYHNPEGEQFYLVDTDGDNILDTVYDMDGIIKMTFESSGLTVDDAALLVSNYEEYLPAADITDFTEYDMSRDIIDI